MKRYTYSAIMLAVACGALSAREIEGVVRDAATGQPLNGVRVQAFVDEKYSAMTDTAGHYRLDVPDYVTSLRLERDGYNPMQLPIAGRTADVDAVIFPTTFSLQGETLEATSAQAVGAHISGLTADVSVDGQIGAALGGQLRSVSRGGVPGMGNYMLLGGINSLNANAQPLIVLDGVIMDMQYGREMLHDGYFNNILSNISVEDIAQVTVLRNGTAIYGAKGANGVILIDTKRNRSMATKIDVSVAGRYEQLPKLPDMMNATDYRTYVSELLGTTDTKLTNFKFLREDPNYYYYRIYHNETDWAREVYDEAWTQSYSINVQGGDDVANYNLSVGYTQADATLSKNDFSRFNFRLNSDVKLSKRINVRFDASYSDVSRDLRDDGVPADVDDNTIMAPGFLSLIKAPFLSPYAYDTQGRLSSFLADADDYLDEVLGSEASLANPLSILRNGEAKNKNDFGNRFITLGITPSVDFKHGLRLSEAFSFVMLNTDENYYLPLTGVPSYKVEGVGTVHNLVQAMSSHQYLTTSDTRLSWNWKQDGHDLGLMGGFRYNLSRYVLNSMRGYNAGNDKKPDMSANLAYKKTDGSNEKVTTLTYYLQGDYNYAGRYLLNAGVSAEASSRFGRDADGLKLCGVVWGLFPSATASWVLTNEPWYRGASWMDYLRLSLGYDMSGNDDLDLNASRTWFGAVTLLSQLDGITVGNIGNTRLKWETTHRLTWGADASLLDTRLALSLHAYKSWTSDLLSLQRLPYVIGHDYNWGNGGKLENSGLDVTVTGKLVNTRRFQWELGASVGHYHNKITQLPNGGESLLTKLYGADILTEVGHPVGLFYGYKTDGVFTSTGDAQEAALYVRDRTGAAHYFEAGDMHFQDLDGNGEINEKDRAVIGNPNPDIYGNIFTRLAYRNWRLDVAFNYSLGNDVYNYQRSILESGSRFYNQTTALRGRWIVEGQQTDIPRLSYEDPMGNARFSDRWIEDGSYLRLKNVTLSYDWQLNKRFLQGITFWVAANNLVTLTSYLGSDPEFSAGNGVLVQGIDTGRLPGARSFSAGMKINL